MLTRVAQDAERALKAVEQADGVTTVRFTHSGLWDEAAVRSHEGGWSSAFDNLERTLEAAA